MATEYEAKFLNIDIDELRTRLSSAGATLERPEYLQKRWVFDLPKERHSLDSFVRVRDEGDIVTMTWKHFQGDKIDDQKEVEIVVDSFENAAEILTQIGCTPRSYQESKRELWSLADAEFMIDTWPYFETYVEVEANSEDAVREAAIKAGFDWDKALFCGVSKLFQMKYGEHMHMRNVPKITFDMPNPFVEK